MNEFYKLIMWQMAQVLGYEGRKELSDHAILLLVDFNSDLVHPVFIGKNMMLNGIHSSAWSQTTKNIITNAIAENYRSEVALFFSENASRRKYEKQRVYDSLNYVSILENGQKWTHCIQSLFMTTDSIGMITERFKSDESFGESTDGVFPETPIQPQSSTPHLMAFYLVIEVDAMRKSLESLRYLASHDQLTGLYNRHMMGELIKNEPSIVVILDIDKFKSINDRYGHDAGDEALCTLASRLEVIFWQRDADFVFRLGGDEFLVVLKNTSEPEAVGRIKQLCEPMTFISSSGKTISFTVSVGYAICESDFKSAMKKADEALYRVKENGRNGFGK